MKVFFYVMAHKLPEQVAWFTRILSEHGDKVCVHVDGKVDAEPFARALRGTGAYILDKRIRVYWGGFSQVKCILSGLREFEKSGCDYFVLLSGQDLPLKPIGELKRHLKEHAGKCFLTIRPAEEIWDLGRFGRNKIFHYMDAWSALRHHFSGASCLINKIEGLFNRGQVLVVQRTFNRGVLYGGSSWFALPESEVRNVLRFCDKEQKFLRYFKRCVSADEMIFHTILGNRIPSEQCFPSLTFDRFENGSRNPRLFSVADSDILKQRSEFFARKFDVSKDPDILIQLRHLHD